MSINSAVIDAFSNFLFFRLGFLWFTQSSLISKMFAFSNTGISQAIRYNCTIKSSLENGVCVHPISIYYIMFTEIRGTFTNSSTP